MGAVGIEEVRNYWDRRPCNVRHSQEPVGSGAYYEEVRARRYFVEPHIPGFAQFDRWRGKRVLEVGCGIGTDGAMFAEAGAHYTGTELSSESLALARQCFARRGLRGEFFRANAESLSSIVPPARYDLVYSFGVLHHTPCPERAIAEIKKYLGVGSELRLMLYARRSWKSGMIALGLDQPEAQHGCPIAYTYSGREVRELLRDFEVVSVRKAHIFPYRVADYVEHRYVKAFPWSMVPDRLRLSLGHFLGWHLLIVARLK